LGGARGKKLPVVLYQVLIDALPLACEEVTHHLVALGQGLGFELVESGFLLEASHVGGRDLDLVEIRDLVGLALLDLHALDDDTKAGHGGSSPTATVP
jgi:hypothetical protein